MSHRTREEINRENAQHSTGPNTPEGKANSSRNRTTHNLTGAHVLLPGESAESFDDLHQQLIETHCPVGATEEFLVSRLAKNQWRILRVSEMTVETGANVANSETPNQSPAACAAWTLIRKYNSAVDAHVLLHRYETSLDHAYDRTLRQLTALQAARFKREEKFSEETTKVAANPAPQPPQPTPDPSPCETNPPATPPPPPPDRKPPVKTAAPCPEPAREPAANPKARRPPA